MAKGLDLKKLGERITELRIAAGYDTPQAFAATHNIPIEEYLTYEEGVDMEFLTLIKLAQHFGVKIHKVFEGLV